MRNPRARALPLNRISGLHLAAALLCRGVDAPRPVATSKRRTFVPSYDAVMDVVKTHYGAYGIGVEYVYTLVHKAPPTVFPEYVVPSAASHR